MKIGRFIDEHPDNGCEYNPSCLQCSFALCRYDYPGGIDAFLRAERDAKIRASELPARVLAEQFGLSIFSVYRIREAQ